MNECAALEPSFATLGAACRRLDQLYIPTRYPNGLPDSIRFWKARIEETDADNTFPVGLLSTFRSFHRAMPSSSTRNDRSA